MAGSHAIIVDLTREVARVCVATRAAALTGGVTDGILIPYRVAIRDEEPTLLTLAGEDAAGISEDQRTIIFDNLHTELLRIEDAELQSQLASAFWSEIYRSLSRKGWLKNPAQPVNAYVIPHYLSPPAFLERFRLACATVTPLRVAGFFNEALSLLIGFLQSEAFNAMRDELDSSSPLTICLITAEGEDEAEVACFDYSLDAGGSICILLQDYVRTTPAGLPARLESADWLPACSALVSLESPGLSGPSKAAFDAALAAFAIELISENHQVSDLAWMKAKGAAYIADCCSSKGSGTGEYRIEIACHIGIRINQNQFYPLITKEDFEKIVDFPYTSLQTFKLQGRPGNEMRIQLYCGYSDRVEDSTLLGHLTLSQSELVSLASGHESALAAVLKLDAQGSGEFTLGLMPDNRIISSMAFTLPGLVV